MNHVEVKRRQIQAFARILGIVTLIVLGKAIGDNGIAYLAAAMESFMFFFLLLGNSVPDALGRMLRSRNNKNQFKNAAKIRRNVLIFQTVLGSLGAAGMFLASDILAEEVLRMPYAALAIRVMAPALLLRMISGVLLGYFQGNGTQMPTVAVSLLRQVFWLVFGLLFCRMLSGYGEKAGALLRNDSLTNMYGAVGAAAAMIFTELLLLVFLVVLYFGSRRGLSARQEGLKTTDSFWGSIGILYGGMSTSILLELLWRLPLWLGIIFYQKNARDIYASAWDYGVYYSKYLALCGIPALLFGSLLLPLTARAAGNLRREEHRYAREVFATAFQLGVVNALFAAVFLTVLSDQAAGAFFKTGGDTAALMLRTGSAAILFLVLGVFFARILTITGKTHLVLCSFGAYAISFIIGAVVFLNVLSLGIQALVYAGLASSVVLCGALGFFAFRQMRPKVDILHCIVFPAGAAAVSGVICLLLGKAFTPHLGDLATLLICLVAGAMVYWVILVLFRSFREQQMNLIPGGVLIVKLKQLLRI